MNKPSLAMMHKITISHWNLNLFEVMIYLLVAIPLTFNFGGFGTSPKAFTFILAFLGWAIYVAIALRAGVQLQWNALSVLFVGLAVVLLLQLLFFEDFYLLVNGRSIVVLTLAALIASMYYIEDHKNPLNTSPPWGKGLALALITAALWNSVIAWVHYFTPLLTPVYTTLPMWLLAHPAPGPSGYQVGLRASGNFLQPNHLASMLAIGAFCLMLFRNQWKRFIIWTLIVLISTAMAFAQSRTGVFALFLMAACLWITHGKSSWTKEWLPWMCMPWLVVLLQACFPLLLQWLGVYELDRGRELFSLGTRIQHFRNAWELFLQNPWFGVGWNGLTRSIVTLNPIDLTFPEHINNAHNIILHFLVETGAVVTSMMLGLGLFIAWRILKLWRIGHYRDHDLSFIGLLSCLTFILHSMVEFPYMSPHLLLPIAMLASWSIAPQYRISPYLAPRSLQVYAVLLVLLGVLALLSFSRDYRIQQDFYANKMSAREVLGFVIDTKGISMFPEISDLLLVAFSAGTLDDVDTRYHFNQRLLSALNANTVQIELIAIDCLQHRDQVAETRARYYVRMQNSILEDQREILQKAAAKGVAPCIDKVLDYVNQSKKNPMLSP